MFQGLNRPFILYTSQEILMSLPWFTGSQEKNTALPGRCAKVAGEICKGAKVKSTPSPRPKTGGCQKIFGKSHTFLVTLFPSIIILSEAPFFLLYSVM